MTDQAEVAHGDFDDWEEMFEKYLSDWKQILSGLLDWPADRVICWANDWERRARGAFPKSAWHEPPVYYIIPLLVPARDRDRMAVGEYPHLIYELEATIAHTQPYSWDDSRYDWKRARQEVKEVLHSHGVEFPPTHDTPPFMQPEPSSRT